MNTRKHKKSSKRILLTVLALMLVMCMGIAGTLAYLSANTNPVTNTFIAAGGGKIIDPSTEAPEIDDATVTLTDGFFLVESKATFANGAYTLSDSEKVVKNTYESVVPAMEVPKNPSLTVNIADGVKAYIFVKVTDTTNSNLTYTMGENWTAVTGVTGVTGLYCYSTSPVLGTTTAELSAVAILKDNQVAAANSLTDTDNSKDGMQLGELKFEAYICQAEGFDSAAAAYTACFVTTTTD